MKTRQDFFEYEVVKGCVVGSFAMFAATPGINYVVSKTTEKPMPWTKPFTGAHTLAGAGAVQCATSFYFKSLLLGDDQKASDWKKSWTAFAAGIVSGVVLCPFESIAQTQLTTQKNMLQTATLIYKHHGALGFSRGMASMMLREGAWSAMYIALVPLLSQRFKTAGHSPITADLGALTIAAGLFGVMTTPVNRMRILCQENLAHAKAPKKSYRALVSSLWHAVPDASKAQRTMMFFGGGVARSLTSVVAGGLIVKGNEWYQDGLKWYKA